MSETVVIAGPADVIEISGPADTVTVAAPGTQTVEVGYAQPGGGGIPGVTVSGTPTAGDLLTATSPSAANWQPVGFRQDFAAASVVTVTHNLGRYPAVTITDTAGDIVHGDIVHLSLDAVRLTFSAPFGGTAICT